MIFIDRAVKLMIFMVLESMHQLLHPNNNFGICSDYSTDDWISQTTSYISDGIHQRSLGIDVRMKSPEVLWMV